MTMPSRVSAERSLWAQIAAIASLRVSMNFTAQILRLPARFGCITEDRLRVWPRINADMNFRNCSDSRFSAFIRGRLFRLFPPQRFNGIESRGFPRRPQAEDDPNA